MKVESRNGLLMIMQQETADNCKTVMKVESRNGLLMIMQQETADNCKTVSNER